MRKTNKKDDLSCVLARLLQQNTTDWVVHNNQKFISQTPGAWEVQGEGASLVSSGEGRFLIHSWHYSLCPRKRVQGPLKAHLCKDANTIYEGCALIN